MRTFCTFSVNFSVFLNFRMKVRTYIIHTFLYVYNHAFKMEGFTKREHKKEEGKEKCAMSAG